MLVRGFSLLAGIGGVACMALLMRDFAVYRTSRHGKVLQHAYVTLTVIGLVPLILSLVVVPRPDSLIWFMSYLGGTMVCGNAMGVIGLTVVLPRRIKRGWHAVNDSVLILMRPRALLVRKRMAPPMTDTETARLDQIEGELRSKELKLLYSSAATGWSAHLIGPSGEDLDHTDGRPSILEAAEMAYQREIARQQDASGPASHTEQALQPDAQTSAVDWKS